MNDEPKQWQTVPPTESGWYWVVPRQIRQLRVVQIFLVSGTNGGLRYSHLESQTASSKLTDSSFHAYRRMTEEPPSLQGVPL